MTTQQIMVFCNDWKWEGFLKLIHTVVSVCFFCFYCVVILGCNSLCGKGEDALYYLKFVLIFPLSFHRALIAGGGAPEIELALRLAEYARSLGGMEAYCVRAYADALEVIPSTLAENAGLNPISTVTELRNRHAQGEKTAGINVRKVQ